MSVSQPTLPSPLLYQVLYYKRSNKVHKSKGVAKMDGRLSIAPPPKCVVTLSEDDGSSNKTVLSGIYRDVSKRAFSDNDETKLEEDSTVIVGHYECEIMSCLSGTAAAPLSSTAVKPMMFQKKKPSLLPSKKKARGLGGGTKKIQPSTKTATRTFSTTATASSWQQRRVPPPQPQKKQSSDSDDDEQEESDKEQHPAPTKRTMLPSQRGGLLSKKRAKVAVRRVLPSTKPTTNTTSTNTTTSIFPNTTGLVVPPSIQKTLRPHQVHGVAFLWNCLTGQSADLQRLAQQRGLLETPQAALLCDEMGSGKTLMTIALAFGLYRAGRRKFVIVCPSSLVQNWSKEFDKWLGKASQPKRIVVTQGGDVATSTIKAFLQIKPRQSEVLILSYDKFRLNADLLGGAPQAMGLLVVDEGHRLKNSSGSLTLTALQQLPSQARLLITGTPIQNNLLEFYTLTNFCFPGLLGDVATFRREYERPIAAANNKSATWEQRTRGHAQSQALDAMTKTFMLRRLQKDILKSVLPPRHELLLFCRPSPQQCALYKTLASKARSTVQGSGGTAEALTVLTNLRKLCSHPRLLQDENSNSGDANASDVIAQSGKLKVLSALLHETKRTNPSDKIVIVSNFTSALDVIQEAVLKSHNWPFLRLDGSTAQSDRQSLVDSFNRSSTDKSFAFLLSSKAGGCGLNMIGANRLVMFDADFNPATDMQSMARIYRQGQKKPCYIYRFFTTGTLEEVIYQRQCQKGNLATLTVDGSSSSAMKKKAGGFTKEELRDCFTLKENCSCDTKTKMGRRWAEFRGVQDLQDFHDLPLLHVAKDQSSTLSFVHLVSDQSERDDSLSSTASPLPEKDDDDESSDEECEFQDDEEEASSDNKSDCDSEEEENEFEG